MYDTLDLDDIELVDTDRVEVKYEELSEGSIVPKKGNYLGLDISQNSTGICLYSDGEKYVYNSSVVYDKNNPHAESLIRKQLKDDLLEVIDDRELDLIVIEDVFEGINPETVRKLYALNTAIDDLIIEDKVICKEFVRVQNVTWKSWLSVVDTEGKYKGFNDKEKIKGYLGILGITEEGEGYQDRLDATGMLIGYFLQGKTSYDSNEKKKRTVKVSFNDIVFDFEPDTDLIVMAAAYSAEEANVIFIKDTKITKKKILEYMSSNISAIFITSEPVRLGLLAESLNLNILEDGGYFGFWLTEKAQKKYQKKLERLK